MEIRVIKCRRKYFFSSQRKCQLFLYKHKTTYALRQANKLYWFPTNILYFYVTLDM